MTPSVESASSNNLIADGKIGLCWHFPFLRNIQEGSRSHLRTLGSLMLNFVALGNFTSWRKHLRLSRIQCSSVFCHFKIRWTLSLCPSRRVSYLERSADSMLQFVVEPPERIILDAICLTMKVFYSAIYNHKQCNLHH
jgi:hypothetical protein